MYRLVTKADGSFQILDDDGENHGIFGDRDEAISVLDSLSTNKKFPNIVIHQKEGMSEKKYTMPVLDIVQELNEVEAEREKRRKEARPLPKFDIGKSLSRKPNKPVIKKSPIKAKRGRPKKR